ncbi:MAG: DUF4191 domain-containing protein [Mycobacteriales bacterium]
MPSKNPESPGRVAQMKAVYRLAAERDPMVALKIAGPTVAVLVVFVVIGVIIGQALYLSVAGVVLAIGLGTFLFGRRANAAVFSRVEGQPGAAAAIVQSLRGDWRVTPGVAVTRSYDIVHRVVGRPGIVLIGEGTPSRVSQRIAQEKNRVGRVAGETPIYDVSVGDGDGQVPLRRLQPHLMKLPRNLRPKQVDALEKRMRALGAAAPPVPKGPLPRGVRPPRPR